MGWQFGFESTGWPKHSMATMVLGCFLLGIIVTGGTVLATRFLLNWFVGQ
jgi:hypothetical protein